MSDDEFYNYIYELESIFINNFLLIISFENCIGNKLQFNFCNILFDLVKMLKSFLLNLFTSVKFLKSSAFRKN